MHKCDGTSPQRVCLESESWSWSVASLDRIKGLETKLGSGCSESEKGRRNVERLLYEDSKNGTVCMENMKLPLPKVCGEP